MTSFPRIKSLIGISAVLLATACSTDFAPGGRPLPQLTFDELAPLQINAAQLVVDDNYNPSADPKDVSSRFPGPPDKVLGIYARHRLQTQGSSGVLHFVIEDAHVHQSKVEQDLKIARSLQLGESDEYKVGMKITLYIAYPDHEGPRTTLTFGRSTTVPRSDSLADKEFKELGFLEDMMKDVDKGVVTTVQGPLQKDAPAPVYYSPQGSGAVNAYDTQEPPAQQKPMPLFSSPQGYNNNNNEDAAPAQLPDPSTSPF